MNEVSSLEAGSVRALVLVWRINGNLTYIDEIQKKNL